MLIKPERQTPPVKCVFAHGWISQRHPAVFREAQQDLDSSHQSGAAAHPIMQEFNLLCCRSCAALTANSETCTSRLEKHLMPLFHRNGSEEVRVHISSCENN